MNDELDIPVSEMVYEWPIRSTITVCVPVLFVVSQFANSYYHDMSFVYPTVFSILVIGMCILMLQQQFTEFRIARMQSTGSVEEE